MNLSLNPAESNGGPSTFGTVTMDGGGIHSNVKSGCANGGSGGGAAYSTVVVWW